MRKTDTGLSHVAFTAARRAKLLTAGLAASILGSVALALVPPLVLERAVNGLAAGVPVAGALAALYFALLALSGVLSAAREVLIALFGQKVTHGLRSEMCAKLSRLPADYFTQNEPGATVSRFVNDVDTVEDLFASGIVSMFADACTVVSLLAVIFVKSRGLGILMLFVTPALFWLTRTFQKNMLAAQLQNRAAVARVNHFVPETILNIRMVHTLAREPYMEQRYDRAVQDSYRALEKSNFYDAVYSPIVLTLSAVIIAAMMLAGAAGGALQNLFGMTVGTAVALIAYVGRIFSPIESIGMEIQSIQSAVAGVQRIDAFLREGERGGQDAALTARALRASGAPAVALTGVSFAYRADTPVLQNVSFAAQRGESITLTGRTGAGKSTIFKLLLGLYAPDNGSVHVFGADACRIPDCEKRSLMGYVEQTFRPVPGTVQDQITLFDPALCGAAAEKAARLAGIDGAIRALEKGYDTPFTEALFSQGQLQLLAIARAVAADPPILLLDEITANLDSATEAAVLSALQSAARERTVLSISHRLYEKTGGRRFDLTPL